MLYALATAVLILLYVDHWAPATGLLVLLYVICGAVDLFRLWYAFSGLMNMKTANEAGRLEEYAQKGGKLLLATGMLRDVRCNLLYATWLLLEPPKWGEWTVSQRLQRLVNGDPSHWRTRHARWYARVLMNSMCPPDEPHIQFS